MYNTLIVVSSAIIASSKNGVLTLLASCLGVALGAATASAARDAPWVQLDALPAGRELFRPRDRDRLAGLLPST
jgi:hypothetical protein